jgi:hypothetical protein
MAAVTPKADIGWQRFNVRFVPEADIPPFIRLVGARHHSFDDLGGMTRITYF